MRGNLSHSKRNTNMKNAKNDLSKLFSIYLIANDRFWLLNDEFTNLICDVNIYKIQTLIKKSTIVKCKVYIISKISNCGRLKGRLIDKGFLPSHFIYYTLQPRRVIF